MTTSAPPTGPAPPTPFGEWIKQTAGTRSLRDVAREGGMTLAKFRYYYEDRYNPARGVPLDVLQEIAQGLRVPLPVVHDAVRRAQGQLDPSGMSARQRSVLAAMADLSARDQQAVADLVLRLCEHLAGAPA